MTIPRQPETYSLYGEPLYKSPIMLWLPEEPEAYEAKIKELNNDYLEAKKDYAANQDDPEKLLWFARKTEILGNFMESTGLYSVGIKKWPDNSQFYRFRGHRFALLRRLDLAIADFNKAAELIEGKEDIPEVYASGPNPDKLGISSFNWNVYYHQGFTYIAAGMFKEAEEAYWKCFDNIDVVESTVSTTHWIIMALLRQGKKDKVQELLDKIELDMSLVEVGAYYDTLKMYKGVYTPDELLDMYREKGGVSFMVPAQAIANMYLAEGKTEKAVELYKELHEKGNWTGGVHLIAEAELKALGVQL
jgi:pentatricopeptide repeat protein